MSGGGNITVASFAAVGAAALAPALIIAFASGRIEATLVILPFVIPVAGLHLLVALPLYLGQALLGRVGWLQAGFTGFVAGGVPIPLLILWLRGWDVGSLSSWAPGLSLGCAGLVGGLAFRAALGPGEGRDAL